MAGRPGCWEATVLTLFPEMFPGPLGHSLAGNALKSGLWALRTLDIRDFARDKHRTVDDAPFGGGAGMVMRPDVIDFALSAATIDGQADGGQSELRPLIYLSPRGRPLDQRRVRELTAGPGPVLLCGRYEGIDERVLRSRRLEEISLGDFVLSGGEIAALALLDACVRLLPGVMGRGLKDASASLEEESFEGGLLEYPQYTRPRTWNGIDVPDVLVSGDHAAVRTWRRERSEEITRERRPDLWARYREQENGGRQAPLHSRKTDF